MKNCRDIEPMLTPYVDGEAPAADRSEVHAHLEACPPCRDAAANERTAREVVGACRDRLRGAAPSSLRARCAASAGRLGGDARWRPGWRTLVPLSVAASLLLAIAGIFIYSAVNQVEALAAQLSADHAKCIMIGNPAPGDPAAQENQWAKSHSWEVRAPASSPEHDLQFLTIRQCLVTDGRTAHLMYKWRGEPLSVFVLPKAVDAIDAERIRKHLGYDARLWSERGRTYAIVGSYSTSDIEPVFQYVKARTR